MQKVRDDPEQFGTLIAAASQETGLDSGLIEKDYWVVETLRALQAGFDGALAGPPRKIVPVFKGGTSLSKAFNLIHRFSEDVDLLIPCPRENGKLSYSQKTRNELLKLCAAAVSDTLHIEGKRDGGRRGVDRHWRYPYSSVTKAEQPSLRTSVLVEVTVMGGDQPSSKQEFNSFIGEVASEHPEFSHYAGLFPIEILTLAPQRTLVEKLALLHDAGCKAREGDTSRLSRAGRHFYDVALILQDSDVRNRLSSDWVQEIADDADEWSEEGNYPYSPRPEGGFAASPVFNDRDLIGVVSQSYTDALDWVWGSCKPSLEESIDIVRSYANLL